MNNLKWQSVKPGTPPDPDYIDLGEVTQTLMPSLAGFHFVCEHLPDSLWHLQRGYARAILKNWQPEEDLILYISGQVGGKWHDLAATLPASCRESFAEWVAEGMIDGK